MENIKEYPGMVLDFFEENGDLLAMEFEWIIFFFYKMALLSVDSLLSF